MNNISDMICNHLGVDPPRGDLRGVCMICGAETDEGLPFKDSGSFTTYHLIQGGHCLCPACSYVRGERWSRSSMWALGANGFRLFKFAEAREMLEHPPEPPFMLFFTRCWKKPGWIALAGRMNYSHDRFIVALDYDLIEVVARERDEYLSHIDRLLAAGVTKTEMSTGRLRAKSFGAIRPDDARLLTERAGSPLWDLCVFVARKKK